MDLQFTLEEMEEVYAQATAYTNSFKATIDSLDSTIQSLATYWTSDETGTYQTFKSLYETRKQTLTEAYEYMKKFCAKIEEMKNNLDEASNRANSKFE